jgi:hypothetical protein
MSISRRQNSEAVCMSACTRGCVPGTARILKGALILPFI